MDVSYWFSKALDLGSSYTNTAYDADSRLGRSQSEFNTHEDMKGLSEFDQPNAFLWHLSYTTPAVLRGFGGWTMAAVTLLKNGTPFTVVSGSDAPGYGNVDGNGGDRPNLLDPSILGRTIGNPDTSRQLLPACAFAFIHPTDADGNLGRNTFRRGGIHNVNASLSRSWTPPSRNPADFSRRGDQPVQHTAVRGARRGAVVAEFRADHEHAERRPHVPARPRLRILT